MSITPENAAQSIVKRLKGTWRGDYGLCRCPAHNDRRASLSVTPGRTAVLFKCFAGCSFEEITAALKSYGDNVIPDTPGHDREPRKSLDQLCRDIWARSRETKGTPAQIYLDSRKIGHSTAGRYDPAAVTYENGVKVRLPAYLLPIKQDREIIALHRIFLDKFGRKNPALEEPKRTLSDPKAGAIQIGAIEGGRLNLAEGFEDAESAIALHNLAGCWAVCGIERYAMIELPAEARHITIFSQHGKHAAACIEKARPRLTADGRTLEIIMPPARMDWNDALCAG